MYCKPGIRKAITHIQSSTFSIWLKLDKYTLGLQKTIFLCFCYIKPYQNKEESELIFNRLQSEILKFKQEGEVLISGDFNARTGGLQDFVANDDIKK